MFKCLKALISVVIQYNNILYLDGSCSLRQWGKGSAVLKKKDCPVKDYRSEVL